MFYFFLASVAKHGQNERSSPIYVGAIGSYTCIYMRTPDRGLRRWVHPQVISISDAIKTLLLQQSALINIHKAFIFNRRCLQYLQSKCFYAIYMF